ncbi:MAG: hypothetical protein PHY62_02895 [Gallionella sp.]|nr:hypothetical protein [Gallionella sp.]
MSTENKIYWGVGIVSVLIFIGTFFIPGEPRNPDDMPWHIEHPTPQTSRVFGMTLGTSTADEAEKRFKELGIPSMFKSPEGKLGVEVFFEQVDLAQLRAKIVLIIAVPDAELHAMYERGIRMSATGSGKKITLTPDDVTKLRGLPISGLTYIPGLRVEDAIFLKRFGQPTEVIKEKESGAIHWLYPQHGLDITLGGEEKPVLQYVSPSEFDKLRQPLLAKGETVKS